MLAEVPEVLSMFPSLPKILFCFVFMKMCKRDSFPLKQRHLLVVWINDQTFFCELAYTGKCCISGLGCSAFTINFRGWNFSSVGLMSVMMVTPGVRPAENRRAFHETLSARSDLIDGFSVSETCLQIFMRILEDESLLWEDLKCTIKGTSLSTCRRGG